MKLISLVTILAGFAVASALTRTELQTTCIDTLFLASIVILR